MELRKGLKIQRKTLSSTLCYGAMVNCKTFIHRFDSDRRLHSFQSLRLPDASTDCDRDGATEGWLLRRLPRAVFAHPRRASVQVAVRDWLGCNSRSRCSLAQCPRRVCYVARWRAADPAYDGESRARRVFPGLSRSCLR